MSLYFKPIHPAASPSAQEENKVSEVILQSGAETYTGLAVSCTNFTLDAMLDLKFDFGHFSGKTDLQFFLLEMACYTPTLEKVEARNGTISFIRKGVGFRIGVASWDVSMSVASNLGSVAASASVKGAGSSIEVQTFGGEAIKNLEILRKVGELNTMTPDTLRLLAIAGGQVADIFVDPKSKIVPTPMQAATLDVANKGPVAAALSMQFATESIYRRYSFIQAMDTAAGKAPKAEKDNLNSVIARAAFVEFGIDGITDKPTEEQTALAKRILFLGR